MDNITLIKQLRGRTGRGLLDCKRALFNCNNDIDKAETYLSEYPTHSLVTYKSYVVPGCIDSYICNDNKKGIIVEVNCDKRYTENSIEFKSFVKEVMLQLLQGESLQALIPYIKDINNKLDEKVVIKRYEIIDMNLL